MTPGPVEDAVVRRARLAADAIIDKKGTDVSVVRVADILAITDAFVIASASNTRQVKTIVEEVERALAAADGSRPRSVEGLGDASWVLLDYGDLVVHVFLDETRAYYDLDRLWADAPSIPVAPPAPPVAASERR
ncbi:MAG TPA: ribosome silencing factor [Acidimicrobiia bacterium]|nr:ribosome silencing factor [Acidimicrobiia bacterium]